MSKINGEVLAAITMAIYNLQDEAHDVESNIITIQRQTQDNLPWNEKSLGMRKLPNKK